MSTDLSPLQRSAVKQAARATWRMDQSLPIDDRTQIAALAVLEAVVRHGASDDEMHAYLVMRCRGAVIDAVRKERVHGQLHSRRDGGLTRAYVDDDGEVVGYPPAIERPDRREELRRVAEAVERMRHPRPLIAWRLAEGASVTEIAAELGVSLSRISQLRREICEAMWEMTDCLD